VLVILASIAVGSKPIPFATVLDALLHYDSSSNDHLIIRSLRVPRTIVGVMVGVALGLAGAVMQGVARSSCRSPGRHRHRVGRLAVLRRAGASTQAHRAVTAMTTCTTGPGRAITVSAVLLSISAVTFCVAIAVGDLPIPLFDVVPAIFGHGSPDSDFVIRSRHRTSSASPSSSTCWLKRGVSAYRRVLVGIGAGSVLGRSPPTCSRASTFSTRSEQRCG
jgi:ABC-type Fe3+-siderophore transport system permease subunit